MNERDRMIAQLRQLKDQQHWTATRVGDPGCAVRLTAADHEAALEWALNELSTRQALSPSSGEGGEEIKAAYKQGWNDREDDLILGADRIVGQSARPSPSQLEPGAAAKLSAIQGMGKDDPDARLKAAVEKRGYCFECGHELHAAFCPACNPEMVSAASLGTSSGEWEPIPLLLFCPKCGAQHVDAPETKTAPAYGLHGGVVGEFKAEWTNPPHKSHLCHACGCIWRPADVATTGVVEIATRGKADNWISAPSVPAPVSRALAEEVVEGCARAIAANGFGRPWGDFKQCNAHDTDQGDLLEYARAALAYLASLKAFQVVGAAEPDDLRWGYKIGRDNREAVRTHFLAHVGVTNKEVGKALGLSVMAVGRHVKTLREEWLAPSQGEPS